MISLEHGEPFLRSRKLLHATALLFQSHGFLSDALCVWREYASLFLLLPWKEGIFVGGWESGELTFLCLLWFEHGFLMMCHLISSLLFPFSLSPTFLVYFTILCYRAHFYVSLLIPFFRVYFFISYLSFGFPIWNFSQDRSFFASLVEWIQLGPGIYRLCSSSSEFCWVTLGACFLDSSARSACWRSSLFFILYLVFVFLF